MADKVLDEMKRGQIPVLIGRAPEFYGPGKTQSFTNALIVDRLKAGKNRACRFATTGCAR